MKWSVPGAVGLGLVWTTGVAAQTPSPSPSPRAQEGRPDAVSETALVNSPDTRSVLTGDTLAASPAQGYGDLLRSVAGLNVIQTSARDIDVTSRQATATLAHSQPARLDGRSIDADFFGFVPWDLLPMTDDIEQIEVVRGPASVAWGPSALTGIVNITTRSPREAPGTSLVLSGGRFSREVGSTRGQGAGTRYGVSGRFARAPSEHWSYKMVAGFFGSDPLPRPVGQIPVIDDPRQPGRTVGGGFYPPDREPEPFGFAFRNEGTRQPKLDLVVDQEVGGGGRITYALGYAGSEGIAHTGIGPFRIENGSHAGYGRVGYRRGALRVTAFANRLDAQAPGVLVADPATGRALPLEFKTRTFDLEVNHSRILGGRHVLSYGGNARRNQFDLTLAPGAKDRSDVGVYLQEELFRGPWRLAAGGRLDKFGNLGAPLFSPRLLAMFKWGPGQSVRLSFSRAFRAPSAIDNFLDAPLLVPGGADLGLPPVVRAVGNTGLKAESLTAYEVGYTRALGGQTTVGIAAYIDDLDDNINLTRMPGTGLEYLNLGPLRQKGLELWWEQVLREGWSAFANYSRQADPRPKPSLHPFPAGELNLPPRSRFNLGLTVNDKRLVAGLAVNHTDKAFWSDVLDERFFGFTAAYTLVDLSLGLRWAGGKVVTSVKARNVLDRDVQQHVFGDILKRSVVGEVRLGL